MRRWSDAEFNTEQMYNQIVKYISLNVSLFTLTVVPKYCQNLIQKIPMKYVCLI